ncbi:MAG: hypothetical protein HQK88_10745 [Nitrospirae bacterium]|nr:hypothetical protein [Nitrospirota bacterium]MBF0521127.1 hypothetical protein [Nitrospirota bacterium]MBF0535300.1 hypothetical protein [Nitrospirota bacterium]MBF0617277.1 hypothetical protein [Nitrospirota bacterium]
MKILKNQSGSIKPIISIIVVVVALYAGFTFAMPQYRYYTFNSDAKEIARLGLDVPKTTALVMEKITDMNIPVKKEDIKVAINEKRVVNIKTQWKETVNFWGIYEHTFTFKVDITE